MGKPTTSHVVVPAAECIGSVEGTRGSETSQYPQEEKTNSDSVSSGERKRRSLATCTRSGSRSRGECGGVEGVTPVDETSARRDAVPE